MTKLELIKALSESLHRLDREDQSYDMLFYALKHVACDSYMKCDKELTCGGCEKCLTGQAAREAISDFNFW